MPKYLGPGSCAANACHGGVAPRSISKVLQNEYSTWVTKDRHTQAYNVLLDPVAQRMGRILNIGAPEKSPKCLVCHALAVAPEQRGREFEVAEGVSCESCHGPSSLWLGAHAEASWPHAKSVALGMYDNKDLSKRSEKCLSCHLGTSAQQDVDHEMIAAGHPDLVFELDSYTAVEPPHWIEKDKDPIFGARALAVGQAIQLRDSMQRLARRVRSDRWPEYAELDCFACHHSLTSAENSWRQERGYRLRPGAANLNDSHFVVTHELLHALDLSRASELDQQMQRISQMVAASRPDREQLASAADHAASLADSLMRDLQSTSFDRIRCVEVISQIAHDVSDQQDERSAEQMTMAVESLYLASAHSAGAPNTEITKRIDALLKSFDSPSTYNGKRFAAELRSIAAMIR